MELNEEKRDNCTLVSIRGRLDTTTYGELESLFSGIIASGRNHILVDCSGMDYVSSSGLRVFLIALKRINESGGKFVICSLQDNIREIFSISGFINIFDVAETRDKALERF